MPAPFKLLRSPTVRSTGGKPPSNGPRSGTVNLADVSMSAFPTIRSGGIYNPRPIRTRKGNGSRWSWHANGSAWDAMVSVDRKRWPKGNPDGWDLANRLVASHETTGIQRIIYAGKIWSIDKVNSGWRNLGSSSLDHFDHLHIEQVTSYADSLSRADAAASLDVDFVAPVGFLRLGDVGKGVEEERAWLLLEDGTSFDEVVHTAVVQFQIKNGLQPDGIIGPNTRGALRDPARVGLVVGHAYLSIVGRNPKAEAGAWWGTQLATGEKSAVELLAGLKAERDARPSVVAPPATPPPAPPPPAVSKVPLAPLTIEEITEALAGCLQEKLT